MEFSILNFGFLIGEVCWWLARVGALLALAAGCYMFGYAKGRKDEYQGKPDSWI